MGCGHSSANSLDSAPSSVAESAQSTPPALTASLPLSEPIARCTDQAADAIELAGAKGGSAALDDADSPSSSADESRVPTADSEQSRSQLLSKRPSQRASAADTREQILSSAKVGEARDISPGRSRPDSRESSRSRKSSTPPSPAEPRRQRRELEERVDERKPTFHTTSAKRGAGVDDDDGSIGPAPELHAAALSHIGANSSDGTPLKEENQVN